MVNKGGKHKRRDRGSPEEDLAMIKRANMAVIEVAEKEDSLTEKQLEMCQEPSLSDLKEMLVDIQISVNNSLFENKRMLILLFCKELFEILKDQKSCMPQISCQHILLYN